MFLSGSQHVVPNRRWHLRGGKVLKIGQMSKKLPKEGVSKIQKKCWRRLRMVPSLILYWTDLFYEILSIDSYSFWFQQLLFILQFWFNGEIIYFFIALIWWNIVQPLLTSTVQINTLKFLFNIAGFLLHLKRTNILESGPDQSVIRKIWKLEKTGNTIAWKKN